MQKGESLQNLASDKPNTKYQTQMTSGVCLSEDTFTMQALGGLHPISWFWAQASGASPFWVSVSLSVTYRTLRSHWEVSSIWSVHFASLGVWTETIMNG